MVYFGVRNNFDKYLKQSERAYRYALALKIDKNQKTWSTTDNSIPIKIVDEERHIVKNEQSVLNRCKLDFEKIYNSDDMCAFHEDHYIQCLIHKHMT